MIFYIQLRAKERLTLFFTIALKISFVIFLITITMVTQGQITTLKIQDKIDEVDSSPYDSMENFIGKNVRKYIGQEFYVLGKDKRLRQYGYEGFLKNYLRSSFNKLNVYECCDGYGSKYDVLNGKYFKVLDVISHPQANESKILYGSTYFLKLEEKVTKDIVYFEYNSAFKHSFPFVVVGFFEKSKYIYIGKEYILRGRNWIDEKSEMFDIQSGLPVDFSSGTKWICKDFTIEEKFYSPSLVLENSQGERLSFPVDKLLEGTFFVFPKTEADKYQEKFGIDTWDLIMSGKVKIGMTEEMCELSWGKPKKKNQTIFEDKMTDQWVYTENYLYFDNEILTAIQ